MNGGSRDFAVPLSVSVKVSDTMSFTRTAGASVTLGTSFSADIPGVGTAGVSAEMSASMEFSSGIDKLLFFKMLNTLSFSIYLCI